MYVKVNMNRKYYLIDISKAMLRCGILLPKNWNWNGSWKNVGAQNRLMENIDFARCVTLLSLRNRLNQCYSWGGPLTIEIAILNLERMAHWNFKFIGNKWKMAHTMVCPAITLLNITLCFNTPSLYLHEMYLDIHWIGLCIIYRYIISVVDTYHASN